MQRRTPRKVRGSDPPANSDDSWVELGDVRKDPPMTKRKASKPSKPSKPRIVQRRGKRHPIVEKIKNKLTKVVNNFFHVRTGAQGCFVAGLVRCCYAMLYLYSLILLTIQMPTLLDPHKGLLPYFITGEGVEDYDYSIFEIFPQSSLVMYTMFLLGWASGFLLLLGIEPRKAAIGVYFFLCNLQFHNNEKLFDNELRMNKMWAFFLILLPLDHFTIFDDFGGLASVLRKRLNLPPPQQHRRNQSTSWPMWPFRLWQMYTCMVCMGAGFCKLNSSEWRSGNALSWMWYDETVGRLYPAFVVEFLFNRLICIKLQTWLTLLLENICFITIWPLKTRKITFVAIVLLHIGIELALVMHIFEYLSVLGWVCFFVYPDDGKSNSEGLIKNKKNDGDKWTPTTAFRSNKVKTVEMAVAASLLYLLIFDVFPREEMEQLVLGPIASLVLFFVSPPAFVGTKLDALNHLIGISSGPFLVFKGKPWHEQSRMTAVIRFSDGKEPILHQDADWGTSSVLRREIDYWYNEYTDHLYEKLDDDSDVPYYAALSVYLSELYGKGSIDRHYKDLTIQSDNTIESVSIQVHKRDGSELPAPQDWSLFSSIPREWSYESVCQFVFTPQIVQLEDQQFTMPMNVLWERDTARHIKNNCVNYDSADEFLHRDGKYGDYFVPAKLIADDDGDDDNVAAQNKPPMNQDFYEQETGDGEDGDGNDDADQIQGRPNEDADEEDDGEITPPGDREENEDEEETPSDGKDEEDGENEDPIVRTTIRLIEENEDEDGEEQYGLPRDEDENEEEEQNRNDGDDGGSIRGRFGGDADEDEDGEDEGNGVLNDVEDFKPENDEEDGSPDAGDEEDNGNEGDTGPNDGEDNEDGDQDNDGSSDDEQNHRRLRMRS